MKNLLKRVATTMRGPERRIRPASEIVLAVRREERERARARGRQR